MVTYIYIRTFTDLRANPYFLETSLISFDMLHMLVQPGLDLDAGHKPLKSHSECVDFTFDLVCVQNKTLMQG